MTPPTFSACAAQYLQVHADDEQGKNELDKCAQCGGRVA